MDFYGKKISNLNMEDYITWIKLNKFYSKYQTCVGTFSNRFLMRFSNPKKA